MESRVSQQSNSLATTRTSQLITMDNELLMPLVMNHSNNSGLFENIHVFYCEKMIFTIFHLENSPRTRPVVENHPADQVVVEIRSLEEEIR